MKIVLAATKAGNRSKPKDQNDDKLDPAVIDWYLKSPLKDARLEVANNWDFTPTDKQVAQGLADKSWEVRALWLQREDFKLTEKQANALLKDPRWEVRESLWLGAGVVFSPTKKQFEVGMKDPNSSVRAEVAFARLDFKPTASQIEQGLTDKSPVVRSAWAGKMDIKVTAEQKRRGLADANSDVVDTWKKRFKK